MSIKRIMMSTSISFIILVGLLSIVNATYPLENSSKGPGIAGCDCWGMLQDQCNTSEVPIENFPEECTSFLYDGIRIDLDYNIVDIYADLMGIKGYLDKLIATENKVMIYFGHTDDIEWVTALNVNADCIETVAQYEMQSLECFLNQHNGISGLIFVYLERHELHGLSENFKIYIDVMRSTFPELEIGLNLESDTILSYINNTNTQWLDFDILSNSFDFYVLNVKLNMNDCTDQFVKSGVFPLTGDDNINTIDLLINYLESVDIPKYKLHFDFQTYATSRVSSDDYCSTLYPYICSEKIKADDNGLCADTQQTLFEKGKYANENGVGFITGAIDVDDANGSCECGRSFPAFYALLDGFNGVSPPPVCPLFDRC